jgi:hypothetical protein
VTEYLKISNKSHTNKKRHIEPKNTGYKKSNAREKKLNQHQVRAHTHKENQKKTATLTKRN